MLKLVQDVKLLTHFDFNTLREKNFTHIASMNCSCENESLVHQIIKKYLNLLYQMY